ncbi:MAG: hypothetical protein CSA81_08850 [Acidobacteria bacterium]|nr:MAG: hypothetical protein CSA81_08850 [Acidobacteriota bacterium]
MKCRKLQRATEIEGTVQAALRVDPLLDEHCQTCPACRAFFEEEKKLDAALLLAQPQLPRKLPSLTKKKSHLFQPVWGIAASLFLAVTVFYFLEREDPKGRLTSKTRETVINETPETDDVSIPLEKSVLKEEAAPSTPDPSKKSADVAAIGAEEKLESVVREIEDKKATSTQRKKPADSIEVFQHKETHINSDKSEKGRLSEALAMESESLEPLETSLSEISVQEKSPERKFDGKAKKSSSYDSIHIADPVDSDSNRSARIAKENFSFRGSILGDMKGNLSEREQYILTDSAAYSYFVRIENPTSEFCPFAAGDIIVVKLDRKLHFKTATFFLSHEKSFVRPYKLISISKSQR